MTAEARWALICRPLLPERKRRISPCTRSKIPELVQYAYLIREWTVAKSASRSQDQQSRSKVSIAQ